ncbi:MAG: DUF4174 domain-containing protein [Pelagibacteraceae bacterium TMED124]|nr:hypothetical protein [Candidatus Neomarinimicrobiota bacterium]RPG19102.1 MAG: DUF4174 domain-containing protein [Pelagibacteraceae bacterium TMED124]|tara:strand:- start:6048 stop:6467 length:420 start_codon:yes stop_codon:yes gene_type:complete
MLSKGLISTIMAMTIFPIKDLNYLGQLKWKNRVLIIINNDNINIDKTIAKYESDFLDRDFILIQIKNNKAYVNNELMPDSFTRSVIKKIKKNNSGDNVILIGKDGKVKKSYKSIMEIDKIFLDVDKMPMRKKELKNLIK